MTDSHQPEGSGEPRAGVDAPESPAVAGAEGTAPSRRGVPKGVLLGSAGAALVIVVLVLAAFVWPGFLAGPGKPDDRAAAAATALGTKNVAALDEVACHGPDGKAVSQLPPQAMQLIQSAKTTGPATLVIDTQAAQPIDLTIGAMGQTQNVPADVMLGVNDGKWCMLGISVRHP